MVQCWYTQLVHVKFILSLILINLSVLKIHLLSQIHCEETQQSTTTLPYFFMYVRGINCIKWNKIIPANFNWPALGKQQLWNWFQFSFLSNLKGFRVDSLSLCNTSNPCLGLVYHENAPGKFFENSYSSKWCQSVAAT